MAVGAALVIVFDGAAAAAAMVDSDFPGPLLRLGVAVLRFVLLLTAPLPPLRRDNL